MAGERARDGLAVAGLALIGTGCWWIHPAAALIVLGCLLLAGALWGHFHATK